MKYILILFLSTIYLNIFSQSLTKEKVAKIKNATVRVIVDGNISVGTGFFIDSKGTIATCWHVVYPAIKENKRAFIQYSSGELSEIILDPRYSSDTLLVKHSISFDFCIAKLKNPPKTPTTFLKLSNFENIEEGDEIYTCGYPLGQERQFITKGIISTKYKNMDNYYLTKNVRPEQMPRHEALMDITQNRGNSGGAIVKLGIGNNEDLVIGMANFGITPIGNTADSIVNYLKKGQGKGGISMGVTDEKGNFIGSDPNEMAIIFASALGKVSIGVSGAVSINYLRAFLKEYNK